MMETNNETKRNLLTILDLSETTKTALLNTRLNNKILLANTRTKKVGGGYYVNGLAYENKGDGTYKLTTYTVENEHHIMSSKLLLDKNCKLIKGIVNCFGLGFLEADQDYTDILLSELKEKKVKWDEKSL